MGRLGTAGTSLPGGARGEEGVEGLLADHPGAEESGRAPPGEPVVCASCGCPKLAPNGPRMLRPRWVGARGAVGGQVRMCRRGGGATPLGRGGAWKPQGVGGVLGVLAWVFTLSFITVLSHHTPALGRVPPPPRWGEKEIRVPAPKGCGGSEVSIETIICFALSQFSQPILLTVN